MTEAPLRQRNLRLPAIYAGFITVFLMLALLVFSCQPEMPSGSSGESLSGDTFTDNMEQALARVQGLIFSSPDSARSISAQMLRQAEQQQDSLWQAVFLNLLGITHSVQADVEPALNYYSQALSLALAKGDNRRIASIYNNMGNVYKDMGNHHDGLSSYFLAQEHYKKSADSSQHANVLNNIGVLYADLGNEEKASSYYSQAYNIFKLRNDSIGMDTSLSNMAYLHLLMDKPDSALFYYEQAIFLQHCNENFYNLSVSYKGMGDTHTRLGNYEEARVFYEKSRSLAADIQFLNQQAEAEIGLAQLNLRQGKNRQALEHANQAMHLAEQTGIMKLLQDAHEITAIAYEKAGLFAESLSHYKAFLLVKQGLLDRTKLHQIYNLEIEKLSKNRAIQQLEIERQALLLSRNNGMVILISVGSLLVVLIIIFVYYVYLNRIRQARRSERNEARVRLSEERSRAALDAEMTERRRLGFELHDGVGPMLSVARLNMMALIEKPELNSERKKQIMESTLSTINEVLKEMKQISRNMAPVVLLEKGFLEAVRDLAQNLSSISHYQIQIDVTGLTEKLPVLIEHTLYRTLQEILNNILLHAEGSHIHIQIVRNPDDLTLMVEDNGRGFDPLRLSEKKGMGLKSAESRVAGLNGELLVDSVPGRGTIITLIIPLVQKAAMNGKN